MRSFKSGAVLLISLSLLIMVLSLAGCKESTSYKSDTPLVLIPPFQGSWVFETTHTFLFTSDDIVSNNTSFKYRYKNDTVNVLVSDANNYTLEIIGWETHSFKLNPDGTLEYTKTDENGTVALPVTYIAVP